MMAVWVSIKDPTCLAIRPTREESERALEEMMPLEDITSGSSIIQAGKQEEPLMSNQRQLLAELFEYLEVVHESLAQACSTLARLSRSLTSNQLKLVLQASIRPLVQLNALGGLLDEPKVGPRKAELPEDINKRVCLTMVADPNAKSLKKEQQNSPTHLLVATFSLKVMKRFWRWNHTVWHSGMF